MSWKGLGDLVKKEISFVTVICLTVAIVTIVAASERSEYSIRLGNDIITMQYPSFIQNDRIYVSIRNLCDVLGIPIYWDEHKNEVYMDVYNKEVCVSAKTEYREEGVIPDEETALIVGKAILEKYADRPMEYETEDKIYYLRANFIETENTWLVVQNFKYKNPNSGGTTEFADFPYVKINKSTGETTYINTHSSYTD